MLRSGMATCVLVFLGQVVAEPVLIVPRDGKEKEETLKMSGQEMKDKIRVFMQEHSTQAAYIVSPGRAQELVEFFANFGLQLRRETIEEMISVVKEEMVR